MLSVFRLKFDLFTAHYSSDMLRQSKALLSEIRLKGVGGTQHNISRMIILYNIGDNQSTEKLSVFFQPSFTIFQQNIVQPTITSVLDHEDILYCHAAVSILQQLNSVDHSALYCAQQGELGLLKRNDYLMLFIYRVLRFLNYLTSPLLFKSIVHNPATTQLNFKYPSWLHQWWKNWSVAYLCVH